MVGRQMDFCKQFYTNNTDHNFDFIFIKEVQYFFRVSTAGANHNHNSDSAWFFKDLFVAGVTDPSEQQSIMDDYSTNTKKKYQLVDNTKLYSATSMDQSTVKNVTSAILIKGLFNKTKIGELNITLSTNRNNSIDSIVPEVLRMMSISDTATESIGVIHLDVIQPNRQNSTFSKSHESTQNSCSSKPSSKSTSNNPSTNTMFSSTSNSLFRSSKSVKQIMYSNTTINKSMQRLGLGAESNNENSHTVPFFTSLYSHLSDLSHVPPKRRSASKEFKIELTFNPNHYSSFDQPPKTIKIRPRLQVLTIQSEKPIPITIDGEFLMESSALNTSRNKFDSLKQRLLQKYLAKWTKLSKECVGQLNVPENVHDDLLALVRMQLRLPCGANGGLDMFETVECNDLI
ncbi:unnamed protein product [Ambrosiozyma monospora]|uniref:Unnamed protein product n=1 Tax=Ambrosiozyma monospora TaxID=43982 RepID=A0ACB5TM24_AMBMO|nr:unnamed protein product [Ambrosiozyma monospora]